MADRYSSPNPQSPMRPKTPSGRKRRSRRLTRRVLFLGIGVGVVYWIIASLLSMLTSEQGTFVDHFFRPGPLDFINRLLVLCFFAFFGSEVSRTLRQRQKADEALAGSEEKHRIIIENIEDGYYEIDRKGRLIIFNNAFRGITGYDASILRQMDYRLLLTPAEIKKVAGFFENVRQTGRPIKALGFVIVRQDGTPRFVETSVSPIADSQGNVSGYRGLLRDVTRRRQADALKQEKMAAESASRSKSEFLANMSHEIRTPLNAIIGMVEMLLESSLTGDQREDLMVVQSAAYALLSVINDVLDFSKIEAGKLELERSPFNLRDFLGEALKILAIKAHEKRLELAYRVAPDVPDRLIGDPHRFRQVLLNLIGNSVKFTESGEIVVFARIKSLKDNKLLLHVAVKDTGVGIATGKQALIFEAFKQADGSTNRKYGGTGLGLAVSAQLVNLMGGRIAVRSELGNGSIFHFTIAFDVAPDAKDGTELPEEVDLNGLTVLVVDDNATNARILCEMLSSWKMAPQSVREADEGLNLMRQMKESGAAFDLALIDSELPEPGTLALIEEIANEAEGATRVVAMLTTTATKQMDSFFEIGVRALVTKPVRPSDLLDAIVQALSKQPILSSKRLRVAKSAIHDVSLPPLTILVAEDTPFNQKYIRRLLDSWHCRSTIVDNGRQAVEALSREMFDLVLMDVQMPEMDGFTATMRIREIEKHTRRHVPIIAMTAHAMRGDRERCLEFGMDDYVSKPISPALLMEAMQRVVPAASAPPPPKEERAPEADAQEDQALEELLGDFNDDFSFFKEISEMFISDYPPMLETIREAIAAKDGTLLERTAHSLKGMARNFRAVTAADLAFALEKSGTQGEYEKADALLGALTEALADFEKRLRAMMSLNR